MAGEPARPNVLIVIADHWARYAIVRWSDSLSSAEERLAHARQLLASTYGEVVSDWDVCVSEAPPRKTHPLTDLTQHALLAQVRGNALGAFEHQDYQVAGGYAHVILFIGILAGEEPIDHYQKSLLRSGIDLPPAVLRAMEIHIAAEARHMMSSMPSPLKSPTIA